MNESPEAREAQEEMARDRRHWEVMHSHQETHAEGLAAVQVAEAAKERAKTGLVSIISLVVMVWTGFGVWALVQVITT